MGPNSECITQDQLQQQVDKDEESYLTKREFDKFVSNDFAHLRLKVDDIGDDARMAKNLAWIIIGAFIVASIVDASGLLRTIIAALMR